MGKSTEHRCETPRCVADIAKYGENYHSVYDVASSSTWRAPKHIPDAIASCEHCGAHKTPRGWKSVCRHCGSTVAPGSLEGLFVPHACSACMEKIIAEDRAAGRICGRCHSVFSLCCC